MAALNIGNKVKAVADTATYTVNWAAWLAGIGTTGDVLTSASWSISPSGLTTVSTTTTNPRTMIRVSGGTINVNYEVTVTATSTLGEIKSVQFEIQVI